MWPADKWAELLACPVRSSAYVRFSAFLISLGFWLFLPNRAGFFVLTSVYLVCVKGNSIDAKKYFEHLTNVAKLFLNLLLGDIGKLS